jgi:hypothetical protein
VNSRHERINGKCQDIDQPRNEREARHLRRLESLGLLPVGICPDCRGAIVNGTGEQTVDEAIAHHQSKAGGCDTRIAARLVAVHINAARPAAAVATMRYLHLKIEADDATAPERHRLRDRITEGVPYFEEATWTFVYDLFGSPYETEAESL